MSLPPRSFVDRPKSIPEILVEMHQTATELMGLESVKADFSPEGKKLQTDIAEALIHVRSALMLVADLKDVSEYQKGSIDIGELHNAMYKAFQDAKNALHRNVTLTPDEADKADRENRSLTAHLVGAYARSVTSIVLATKGFH
ncbi:MAG: hypothetical protein WAO98_04360 [Alphaproteobacteria bacterium]